MTELEQAKVLKVTGEHARGFRPKYLPLPGSKRCRHYLDGGACALASEFMCVEWLKRNRRAVLQDHPGHGATTAPPRALVRPGAAGADAADAPCHGA